MPVPSGALRQLPSSSTRSHQVRPPNRAVCRVKDRTFAAQLRCRPGSLSPESRVPLAPRADVGRPVPSKVSGAAQLRRVPSLQGDSVRDRGSDSVSTSAGRYPLGRRSPLAGGLPLRIDSRNRRRRWRLVGTRRSNCDLVARRRSARVRASRHSLRRSRYVRPGERGRRAPLAERSVHRVGARRFRLSPRAPRRLPPLGTRGQFRSRDDSQSRRPSRVTSSGTP